MTFRSSGGSEILMTLNPTFVDPITLEGIQITGHSLGYVKELCVIPRTVFWFYRICICTQYHNGVNKGNEF